MDTLTSSASKPGRLKVDYLPVGLFGSVLGLVGLSVAWREASHLYGAPGVIADAIGAIAVTVFVALVLGYGWKCLSAWEAAKAEFQHPIAGSLFGTVLISLLLLPLVLVRFGRGKYRRCWKRACAKSVKGSAVRTVKSALLSTPMSLRLRSIRSSLAMLS